MGTFSAVVTTGIYCRPGCPGRPLPGNVRPFTTAAAAEAAGFRACHRCRPYRVEPSVSATGPDLVCRAVRLIVDGALDGVTEDELCGRLGVSPRHLRRLFAEHVGVTPDGLARSRRAHFARRLLDDTDLPVIDVAFASGFGSVRQLNRACHDVFRASPSELRARRRSTDRLAADGGLALRLPFDGPLDFDLVLSYFERRAISGVECVDWARGVYRRTVVIEGDPGVLELTRQGDDVVLVAHLPHWEGLIHVVQRARGILNLDTDMAGAAAVLGAMAGVRPPGCWDPFETGVRAIIGQQVSVAGATTMIGRIAERHGTAVPGLGAMGLSRLFPAADVLAKADLAGLGLTGARAAAIQAFAHAVAVGDVVLDGVADLESLVASLVAVPGVGPWTAHYLALRMGYADAFPGTDLGLRKACPDLAARSESWRPFRAHAAARLWLAPSLHA